MLNLYLLLFGAFQVIAGLCEFIIPYKSYYLWKKWVFHRLFPFHGILLIAAGFPFIIYKGFFSVIIFWIGVFMAITGPFLLFYPEKIRNAFITVENDFKTKDIKIMIYVDASLRFAAGIITLAAYIKSV